MSRPPLPAFGTLDDALLLIATDILSSSGTPRRAVRDIVSGCVSLGAVLALIVGAVLAL